jgi:hypothetical protein
MIDVVAGDYYVTDLASTNGTYVDGEELTAGTPCKLAMGAEVIFGARRQRGRESGGGSVGGGRAQKGSGALRHGCRCAHAVPPVGASSGAPTAEAAAAGTAGRMRRRARTAPRRAVGLQSRRAALPGRAARRGAGAQASPPRAPVSTATESGLGPARNMRTPVLTTLRLRCRPWVRPSHAGDEFLCKFVFEEIKDDEL